MADVFISYARSTASQAQMAASALRGAGYSVWIDAELPTHRAYSDVIEEELAAARAALIIWSAEAARSQWVKSEANRAREDDKLVQMTIDSARLPMPFDQIQCADLKGWAGDLDADGWRKVLSSIADLLGSGDHARPAVHPVLPDAGPPQPLLAVLAFDNLSGDPQLAWFSDGVSDEIQQTLAQARSLKVIGRASSFQFRGSEKAAGHVGRRLNATHVLDGSVRRSGSAVRISAHLVECAAETTLWSQRFDRDLSDVFALQDEIAAAVADALNVVFKAAGKAGPVDPAAYELYLQAREIVLADAEFPRAIVLLEKATAAAPGFARAWAELALRRALQLRSAETAQPYAVLREAVVSAAQTALCLDPGLGGVHQTLALLQPVGRYAERETLQAAALAVAPNDANVLGMASVFEAEVGRLREAVDLAARAFALDPLNFRNANLYAVTLGYAGRAAEGRAQFETVCATFPDNPYAVANALWCAGAGADWTWFDNLRQQAGARGLAHAAIEQTAQYFAPIRNADAEALKLGLLLARAQVERTGALTDYVLPDLYRFGMHDEVFKLIDQASFDYVTDAERPRPVGAEGVLFGAPRNKAMMRDERFPRLCARLGLCAYWVATDRWPDCADEGVLPYDFKAECRRLAGA